MRSIRRHLTLRLLTTVLAVAGVAGSFLYLYARSRLTAEFDHALEARAAHVASMVGFEKNGKLVFDVSDAELSEFRGSHPAAYFQIWSPSGTIIARSPALGVRDLPRRHVAAGRGWNFPLPGGGAGRAVAVHLSPRLEEEEARERKARLGALGPPMLTVVVARGRASLDSTLRVLATSLVLGAGALGVGTALAILLAVRSGLQPLEKLARETDAVGAASLHHRFSAEGMPAELRPICERLNGLFARLEEAFNRERRFTADAAHELRTPIAELRSLAEVALKWPSDSASAAQGFTDTLNISRQMESLVSTLLAIARCEAGRQPVALRTVDLAAAVEEAWKPLQAQAAERSIRYRSEFPPGLMVYSDRALLAPLLTNVLSNAVAYGEASGEIVCRAASHKETAELWIDNPTRAIEPGDLPHLFDPFWRKDPARTGGHHSGLGLALVNAYAQALGCRVEAALPQPHLFRITLALPSPPVPMPAMAEVVEQTAPVGLGARASIT